MKKQTKFITVAAAALLTVSPIIATTVQPAPVFAAQGDKTSAGTLTTVRETQVITKNGDTIRTTWNHPDKDAWQIKAGVAVINPDEPISYTGETMMFQNREYLGVGHDGFINAYTVATLNGKNTFMLNHNSYIYNKKGKRIKNFHGQKKLLKNRIFTRDVTDKEGKGKYYYTIDGTNYTVPSKTIKGKTYFKIGDGGYVKAVNFSRANGSWMYTTEPITVKMMGEDNVVRLNGKKYTDTKIKLKADQKLVVDKLVHIKSLDSEDPALFYHIKGTKNDWVMAEAVTTVNFQMGVTEER